MQNLICIAGNIGSGKTSLTKILAQRFNWMPLLEPVDSNPYLIEFYKNPKKWGFSSSLSFLSNHACQHAQLANKSISIVQDRSIYEHGEIFARNSYQQGYIAERDWDLFLTSYRTFTMLLPEPNLLVYLKASVPILMERIAERNLPFDPLTKREHVLQINEIYEDWIVRFNRCQIIKIDTQEYDFVNNENDCNIVINKIFDGLEEVRMQQSAMPTLASFPQ